MSKGSQDSASKIYSGSNVTCRVHNGQTDDAHYSNKLVKSKI